MRGRVQDQLGMPGHNAANPRMNDPAVQRELLKEITVVDDSNRQEMELLADFYAIIRTMEKLEVQYVRGTIRSSDYEKVLA